MEPINNLSNLNRNEPVEITCLMPTGIIIIFHVLPKLTLHEIKQEIWKEAEKYPLYSILKDKTNYVFTGIGSNGKLLLLLDETQRMCDISLFFYIFKLEDKSLAESDGTLIFTKYINELDDRQSSIVDCNSNSINSIDNVEEKESNIDNNKSIDIVLSTTNNIEENNKCGVKTDSKDSGLEEMNWTEPPGIK